MSCVSGNSPSPLVDAVARVGDAERIGRAAASIHPDPGTSLSVRDGRSVPFTTNVYVSSALPAVPRSASR
jgi:hypothetical protein